MPKLYAIFALGTRRESPLLSPRLFIPLPLCVMFQKKGGLMTILCLGDSLTFGYGVPREDTWCAVAARLCGHEFQNLGVNGATTGEMREQELAPSADALLVMGGLNDLFMGMAPSVPLSHILAICESARRAGLRPVVGIPMQISPDVDEAWCDGPVDVDWVRAAYAELAEALVQACEEHGIESIDFRPLVGPAELSFDGIHLNRRGHLRMAEAVSEFWKKASKS